MHAHRETIVRGHLRFLPLSATEWLVRDGRVPDDDGSGILGVIEETGSGCSVLTMSRPHDRIRVDDLESAIDHFQGPRRRGADDEPITENWLG